MQSTSISSIWWFCLECGNSVGCISSFLIRQNIIGILVTTPNEMPKTSLIEALPDIVKKWKKEAEQIMQQIADWWKLKLQTNEIVIPSKDSNYQTLFSNFQKTYNEKDRQNRLIYGDNLLTMAALIAGDEANWVPSMRWKIDLIYIDPPYDSKADYRTKITLPNVLWEWKWDSTELEQRATVVEQTAYSDLRKDGTISYLEYMYPRLYLMRELLSDKWSIYVHLDWHVWHYVKLILDDIFGKDNFMNEVIRHYVSWNSPKWNYAKKHDTILVYNKNNSNNIFNIQYRPKKEWREKNMTKLTKIEISLNGLIEEWFIQIQLKHQ